jgi:plastocyanin
MDKILSIFPAGNSARRTGIAIWTKRLALAGVSVAMAVAMGANAALAAPALVIKMTDKPPMYEPTKATVKVGDTVEWVNDAKTLHSVTADPDSAQKPGDVVLPPGAKPFDSGFMKPGDTFDYTFTVAGTYKYLCLPHEKDGMIGYVTVTK